MDFRSVSALAQQQPSIPGLLAMLRGGDPQGVGGGGGISQAMGVGPGVGAGSGGGRMIRTRHLDNAPAVAALVEGDLPA